MRKVPWAFCEWWKLGVGWGGGGWRWDSVGIGGPVRRAVMWLVVLSETRALRLDQCEKILPLTGEDLQCCCVCLHVVVCWKRKIIFLHLLLDQTLVGNHKAKTFTCQKTMETWWLFSTSTTLEFLTVRVEKKGSKCSSGRGHASFLCLVCFMNQSLLCTKLVPQADHSTLHWL